MKELLAVTKALSDPNRLRALAALAPGELCLCQIIELLGLAPSTVSKHMAVLHAAGLVQTSKKGRWIYYSLSDESDGSASPALAMALDRLSTDPLIRADAKRLKIIRKTCLDDLCATTTGAANDTQAENSLSLHRQLLPQPNG